MSFKFGPALSLLVGLLWLSLLAVGLGILWQYDHTPGPAANAPSAWPTESRIPHTTERPTLLMFAHPRCPCTQASLGELDRLMARGRNLASVFVVFYQPSLAYQAGSFPKDCSEQWTNTDLWQKAAAIPGVTVLPDAQGREAQLFQASTSGQVMLFDATGQLLFEGGITGTRGHAGDNVGSNAILTALTHAHKARMNGPTMERAHTKVFGCALFETPGASPPVGVQKCNP